jgi:hypothetical protein
MMMTMKRYDELLGSSGTLRMEREVLDRTQYQVVTQLLDSVSQEGYEAYAINEVLHEMITQCPVVHNAL